MKLKPYGTIKADKGSFTGKYQTEIEVMYDPSVPLFYLVDSEGSTTEKIEVTDMEKRHPTIYRRFLAKVKSNPKKGSKKKAKKKAKKRDKKRPNPSMKRLLGRI